MNVHQMNDDEAHANAIVLPGALIQAMSEREGQGNVGLLLTRTALQNLQQYHAIAAGLPADLARTEAWLGFEQIAEPELAPSNMLALFEQLRAHAERWPQLLQRCRVVTIELRESATRLGARGAKVIELVAQSRALGADLDTWEGLRDAPSIVLDEHDRQLLIKVGSHLEQLRKWVGDYDQLVDALHLDLQDFRDTARQVLIPAILEKNRAAKHFVDSPQASELTDELSALTDEIFAGLQEYQRYRLAPENAQSALASHLVSGQKARAVRERLDALRARHKTLSEQLANVKKMNGQVSHLDGVLHGMEVDLWDLVLSTGQLHSAWQTVDAYLESSLTHVQRMQNRQELAVLMFHFKQFVSQWVLIGEHAGDLLKVFD